MPDVVVHAVFGRDVRAEMEAVAQYCNVGCYTYSGSSSADVLDKAETWGRRQFGDAEFTVFIIDMATRRIGIYSSRGIVRVVTKAKANVITDNVYKLAAAGQSAWFGIRPNTFAANYYAHLCLNYTAPMPLWELSWSQPQPFLQINARLTA